MTSPDHLITEAAEIVAGHSRKLATTAHLRACLDRIASFRGALEERDVLIRELLAREDGEVCARCGERTPGLGT